MTKITQQRKQVGGYISRQLFKHESIGIYITDFWYYSICATCIKDGLDN